MKRLSIIVIIGIFIITGCDWQRTSKERSKNAQNQQVIKIGYLPITHSANLMMTKKLLSQYNHPKYKLELVKFNNWPDLMDALNSGRIDGASTLIELAMKSKQKGSNIKAVALGHHEGNVIMGQKGMHLNEFNNNGDDYHFGIPHRYSTHYLLLEELRKQLKIKPGHFSYHEMSPAEMAAALSEHRITGYSVAEPFGALGEKLGKGKTLKHGDDVIPDAYCCVLVLRGELLDQHKDVAQAFVQDYKKSGFKMNDRKQSVDIMTHHFKQSRDVLTQSAAWTSYGDLTIKPSGYQEITTLVKQHHLFNPPAYDDFVEPSLYKEASRS
ncbi:ABC transporter substrate-binding protein [Staphylococcus aureus]|uniref:ABC transporter substrate-binding protein n=1 Tax=Staphylococcus aureus TaxID=1280 RepID=UPI0006B49AFB|nr:ABC transporter substrate-binding protein [Staphylococcus aureus]CUC45424.1 ABC-type nitrate/sulfonate/bicarbonate transporter%2C TauA [Staphylococcus aureus]CUF08808.1 ABC-type nitrate/sulfonate/bicarbonate transporter%2C TauA [Staphylococcus aureus]CUF21836.1 ABC-type nitrate/sulfonate/bicarbonate transporter%2C TauA [Staphylococcus aureus]